MAHHSAEQTQASPTIGPVAQIYRMNAPTGLPKGHALHVHPDTVEICHIVDGWLDWVVTDTKFDAYAGDTVVLPAGEPHGSADATLRPCKYMAIHLRPEAMPEAIRSALVGPDIRGLHSARPEVAEVMNQIWAEHDRPDALSPSTVVSLCNILVAQLARRPSEGRPYGFSNLVKRAQAALTDHSGTPARIADVANALGVSAVWLNHCFREEVGQSPARWALEQRLDGAKRLLVANRLSITQVAIQLGFSSSQYFSTVFQRETGFTPTEYRSLGKQAPEPAEARI